ncbi:hypothetical protein F0562_007607 [Nyssa sinensis]|uniref:Uncharacterized protein n=1 Tax=Nyssa sinensis TaxID=561372 RepID=A0A5J5A794_9ASTE|nr:hypothetical protein F0562_007607 [Nyssa sinensis]
MHHTTQRYYCCFISLSAALLFLFPLVATYTISCRYSSAAAPIYHQNPFQVLYQHPSQRPPLNFISTITSKHIYT